MNVTTNDTSMCAVALSALEYVVDPEIGLNVVDLGLVYEINFDDRAKKIDCTMTLTTQFCPMGASISSAVQTVLQATFPVFKIILTLTFDPAWNYERISEAGRAYLSH
jgi:metal-sulfur cluster biosynthetic enzyme